MDGVERLTRVFRFGDFARALAFTTQVGAHAEEERHHPGLLTEWGRGDLHPWTHKIKGLHRDDFITAAKTDELAPRRLRLTRRWRTAARDPRG